MMSEFIVKSCEEFFAAIQNRGRVTQVTNPMFLRISYKLELPNGDEEIYHISLYELRNSNHPWKRELLSHTSRERLAKKLSI